MFTYVWEGGKLVTHQHQVELVLDSKATLGEGPSWDAEKKWLSWIDIVEQKVHIFNPDTKRNRTIVVDQNVGAAAPRKSGGFVLALRDGLYTLDIMTEQLTPIAHPERYLPNNQFNDGKCDSEGRFWAGTMEGNETKGAGSLYCLDVDHTVRKMVENVTVSNGLTWSPDNKTMYYIDTPTLQIVAFDFDGETGTIQNRRVVVDIPPQTGNPDGMTSDMEGMLWVAHWGGYQVTRWDPFTGKLLNSIPIPAPIVTSCSFGGENMDELFVTTARIGLSEVLLEKYPASGGLFRIQTDVKGVPMYPFGG
jgi:sugar lactone lactonase YvrE